MLPALTVNAAPETAVPWHSSWVGKGLFAIALIFLAKAAQPLLLPVVIAVVLTFLFAPAVRALRRRGVPEAVGAGLLVAALLGAATLAGAGLASPAAQWLERAPITVAQLVAEFDRLRAAIPLLAPPAAPPPPRTLHPATRARAAQPPAESASAPEKDPIKEKIASESVAFTGVVLGEMVSFGVTTAAVVILLYFLLASEHWLLSRTVEAIPRRRTRALVLAGVRGAQREIGQFLFALGIINIGVAIVSSLAMMAIGMPNPVLWGVVCGVLNFIPYIGPLVASGLLLLAGALGFAGQGAIILAPMGVFLLIHAVEANLVSPWFVGQRLTLSPVSVFLSVLFWGWLWGIAGALIAVPLLVGMRSVCKRNRKLRLLCVYLEGGHTKPPSLRSLLRIGPRRRRGMPAEAPRPAPAVDATLRAAIESAQGEGPVERVEPGSRAG